MRKFFVICILLLAIAFLTGCGRTAEGLRNLVALGEEQIHVRNIQAVPPPENHPLIGTWVWNTDDSWKYIFYADGYGFRYSENLTLRGLVAARESFKWIVDDDVGHLTINFYESKHHVELWRFEVEGYELRIWSRQVPGLNYLYLLVD